MASKALALLMASVLMVSVFADFENLDEETRNDMDFIQRDPQLQELFKAEKRGSNLRKYKFCPQFAQDCWCTRKTRRIVFCSGAGAGEDLYNGQGNSQTE